MPDSQPEALTAFLATAGYAITQAPKDITDETGESLRSTASFYAPRLLAAVEAVLALHVRDHQRVPLCEGCDYRWPCPTREAISRELLGEGQTDG